jgi:activator of 2-hydroxyglutaryl-CoA dehydratase
MLGVPIEGIELVPYDDIDIKLSSVCAVFAQSEIVGLIAGNVGGDMIISAVVRQILTQAKPLVEKLKVDNILFSGGLANIKNVKLCRENIRDRLCGG